MRRSCCFKVGDQVVRSRRMMRVLTLGTFVGLWVVAACVFGEAAAPTDAPTPTATPAPLSSGPSPAPPHVRLDLEDGIVVAFAGDLNVDRRAYVTHVPTGAQAVLDADGNVSERLDLPGMRSVQLDALLAHPDKMARIKAGLDFPGSWPENSIADWLDFIYFNDAFYYGRTGPPIDESQLDSLLYRVAFTLDHNLLPIGYVIKNGDAAFLAPGTAIYSIVAEDHSRRLAALSSGEVLLYQRSP